MQLLPFEEPKYIADIQPQFLTDLGDQFPDVSTGTEWYRDKPMTYRRDVLEALQPLTEILLTSEVTRGRSEPWGIYYALDTTPVFSQESQRPPAWHVDVGNSVAAIVADANPTEFIVRTPNPRSVATLKDQLLLARKSRKHSILSSVVPEDDDLESLGLKVHQPQPYEMVLLEDHIHRSPQNPTSRTVQRTWIRAVIHRHAPRQLG